MFSLVNFESRSATVFCDKTVAHCNYFSSTVDHVTVLMSLDSFPDVSQLH